MIIISIFQVCTIYARTPRKTMLRAKDSQRVIPANGRHFGPTYSEMRTNIWTVVPGMKKPIRILEAMKHARLGENEVRNPIVIIAIIDGIKVFLRPNLKRYKVPQVILYAV